MRLLFLLTLSVLLLAPHAAARAEEPTAYPLHTWREVWKAGDVRTETNREENQLTLDISAVDPATGAEVKQRRTMAQRTTFTSVTKCLAADDQGAPTKMLVHLKAWSRSQGAAQGTAEPAMETDDSILGVHVEVVRTATAHAYTLLTPGARPSGGATQWLEKKFGARTTTPVGADLERLGRPAGPVKVGDSWAGDPAKLNLPFALDAAASSVKLTLASVEDDTMVLSVQMRLQLKEYPLGQGAQAPFTEGGMLIIEGRLSHSLAPGTFAGEGSIRSVLQGTAAREGMATVVVGIATQIEGASSTGGEMPPVPAVGR